MRSCYRLLSLLLVASPCMAQSPAGPPMRCSISVESPGTLLRSDTTIAKTGASGFQFAQDSRGNFYGASYEGGQLLKWSPDGTLLKAFGRHGDGPGEFNAGEPRVHVVQGDTLYVRRSLWEWAVLDTELRFLRHAGIGPIMARNGGETHFLPSGTILSTFQRDGFSMRGVMVTDREGNVIRAFMPPLDDPAGHDPHPRPSAYLDGKIWLGPEIGPRAGYVVEIVDTMGTRIHTIRREVDWFVAKPDFRATFNPEMFAFPTVSEIWADHQGFVWVATILPKGPGAEAAYRQTPVEPLNGMNGEIFERNIDVFDQSTHELVASQRIPASQAFMAEPLFNGRRAFRVENSATGTREVRIFTFLLKDSAGQECARRPRR